MAVTGVISRTTIPSRWNMQHILIHTVLDRFTIAVLYNYLSSSNIVATQQQQW